ncbi:MAG: PAS domain S-box protein [Rubrivivax sp.]
MATSARILGIGVAGERVESLASEGLVVERYDDVASIETRGAVLVVTTPAHVAAARERLTETPILVLLAEGDDPVAAVSAGADWTLPKDADARALEAIRIVAARLYEERVTRIAMAAALDLVTDSVEVADPQARLLWVNRSFERMTGHLKEEAQGKTPAQVMRSHLHSKEFFDALTAKILSGHAWSGSMVARRKDGTLFADLATIQPVFEGGVIRRHVAVKQFIPGAFDDEEPASQQEHAELARARMASVSASERRYRAMMESAGDAILIVDADSGHFLEANPAACSMFGYDQAELTRITGRALGGPDGAEVHARVVASLKATGRAVEMRHPMQRKDGSKFWAALQCTEYELFGRRQQMAIVRDVTEMVKREQELELTNRQLEEMQKQLMHTGRLAALGHMAAGVAHEINNPLQYILAGLDELSPFLDGASREARLAHQDMREGVERIRSITSALLPFARVDVAPVEHVDIRRVVEWACRVTDHEIRHRAKLELALGNVPPILADHTRIGQLVTNLLTNAAHAIVEGASDRNRVTITTAFVGGRVRLTIEDTGTGIPEDVRGRIFDPFFTTKPRERGTGLGLPLCAEIVARSGGTIGFDTEVGKGTRFVITFEPAGASAPRAASVPPVPIVRPEGRPRILLVDDDKALLRTFARFLKDFDITTALGGSAALDRLATDDSFDVIVCDVMMPNIDGPMVYADIATRWPGLESRMIFCTGGAFTDRVRNFLASIPNTILDKPIPRQKLASALIGVYDRLGPRRPRPSKAPPPPSAHT